MKACGEKETTGEEVVVRYSIYCSDIWLDELFKIVHWDEGNGRVCTVRTCHNSKIKLNRQKEKTVKLRGNLFGSGLWLRRFKTESCMGRLTLENGDTVDEDRIQQQVFSISGVEITGSVTIALVTGMR